MVRVAKHIDSMNWNANDKGIRGQVTPAELRN
jgi:hypothetical protein